MDDESNVPAPAEPAGSPSRAQAARRVLLAEDDAEMRRMLATALRKDGYEVIEASDGVECVGHLQQWVLWDAQVGPPDFVVSDIRMPGWTGLEILQLVRARNLRTLVILITAFGSAETHAEARRLGAAAVLDKPFDVEELRAAVLSLVPPSMSAS